MKSNSICETRPPLVIAHLLGVLDLFTQLAESCSVSAQRLVINEVTSVAIGSGSEPFEVSQPGISPLVRNLQFDGEDRHARTVDERSEIAEPDNVANVMVDSLMLRSSKLRCPAEVSPGHCVPA